MTGITEALSEIAKYPSHRDVAAHFRAMDEAQRQARQFRERQIDAALKTMTPRVDWTPPDEAPIWPKVRPWVAAVVVVAVGAKLAGWV